VVWGWTNASGPLDIARVTQTLRLAIAKSSSDFLTQWCSLGVLVNFKTHQVLERDDRPGYAGH